MCYGGVQKARELIVNVLIVAEWSVEKGRVIFRELQWMGCTILADHVVWHECVLQPASAKGLEPRVLY